LSIFIVIAMAVCWHTTDEGGFGQQEMSVACLVGTRSAYSEQIAITGENIGFRFKKSSSLSSLTSGDSRLLMTITPKNTFTERSKSLWVRKNHCSINMLISSRKWKIRADGC
jgi:hypothetical protein